MDIFYLARSDYNMADIILTNGFLYIQTYFKGSDGHIWDSHIIFDV